MHAYKSSTLQRLLNLQRTKHPGSQALSLQTDEDEAHAVFGLTPAKPDWVSTLQRISECKAVISVDTAVAHLAAGSGCPVNLLLGNPQDWRWRPIPENPLAPLWYPEIKEEPLK